MSLATTSHANTAPNSVKNLGDPSVQSDPTDLHRASNSSGVPRAPSVFMSHGGGPCFFMEGGQFKLMDKNSAVAQFYRDFAKNHLPNQPKAIIIISAHWEESSVHITSNPQPKLYFDYYGFPEHTYKIEYPARTDVALAQRIHSILTKAGVDSKLDPKRDWDHGIFVPLKLIYPDADVPLVQLSLNSNLDPALHYKIGQLLEPLRDEGYAVLGSGFATHNLREMMSLVGGGAEPPAYIKEWIQWLSKAMAKDNAEERRKLLLQWSTAPGARRAHPREEHLLPLHVVAGAASSSDKGAKEIYNFGHAAMAFNMYKFD